MSDTFGAIPTTRQTQLYSGLLSKYICSAPGFSSNGILPYLEFMNGTVDVNVTTRRLYWEGKLRILVISKPSTLASSL